MTIRVTLRPRGRGAWRPLVVDIVQFPLEQGRLFRKDAEAIDLVERGDTWVVRGRQYRVAKTEDRGGRR